MEQVCHACGAPRLSKKCAYCGTKAKGIKEASLISDLPNKKNLQSFFGIGVVVVFIVVMILSQMDQEEPVERRYLCTHSGVLSAIEMVTIIESRGLAITRWIEEYTFPRQLYIDYNWGPDWDLTDEDIKEWYEGPENVTQMEGTHWEIVSVNDEVVITRFVYNYEIMSRADLDSLWDPNFSSVNHHSAIRSLTDDGAVCVAQ